MKGYFSRLAQRSGLYGSKGIMKDSGLVPVPRQTNASPVSDFASFIARTDTSLEEVDMTARAPFDGTRPVPDAGSAADAAEQSAPRDVQKNVEAAGRHARQSPILTPSVHRHGRALDSANTEGSTITESSTLLNSAPEPEGVSMLAATRMTENVRPSNIEGQIVRCAPGACDGASSENTVASRFQRKPENSTNNRPAGSREKGIVDAVAASAAANDGLDEAPRSQPSTKSVKRALPTSIDKEPVIAWIHMSDAESVSTTSRIDEPRSGAPTMSGRRTKTGSSDPFSKVASLTHQHNQGVEVRIGTVCIEIHQDQPKVAESSQSVRKGTGRPLPQRGRSNSESYSSPHRLSRYYLREY